MHDVLVIGGGLAGLAVAAAAVNSGLKCGVVEKGCLVNNVCRYPSRLLFNSAAADFELDGLPFIAQSLRPGRDEIISYYQRMARRLDKADFFLRHQVLEVIGADNAFLLKCQNTQTQKEVQLRSRKVVVASGCFDQPRLLQIGGEDLPHVSHYYREPWTLEGQRVIIVGGGDSAVEAAIELAGAGARVTLVHRGPDLARARAWTVEIFRDLVARQRATLHLNALLLEIREERVVVRMKERGEQQVPCDAVLLLTGYRPSDELLQKIGITVDLGDMRPMFFAETCETNIAGVHVAGSLLGGTASGSIPVEKFREHAQVIVRDIQSRI